LKESCGLEPRTDFFSFKKSAKTVAKRFINEVHMDIIGVNWLERESNHKRLYNVELTCGAIILCFYMNVRSI